MTNEAAIERVVRKAYGYSASRPLVRARARAASGARKHR